MRRAAIRKDTSCGRSRRFRIRRFSSSSTRKATRSRRRTVSAPRAKPGPCMSSCRRTITRALNGGIFWPPIRENKSSSSRARPHRVLEYSLATLKGGDPNESPSRQHRPTRLEQRIHPQRYEVRPPVVVGRRACNTGAPGMQVPGALPFVRLIRPYAGIREALSSRVPRLRQRSHDRSHQTQTRARRKSP